MHISVQVENCRAHFYVSVNVNENDNQFNKILWQNTESTNNTTLH